MPTENAAPVDTPVIDAPATPAAPAPEPSEAERMEAVFAKVEQGEDFVEPALPDPEPDPAEVVADPEAVADPAAAVEEPPIEEPAAELTDEQRDEADAKALGFKNQKANSEFKAMRAELRELRPLKEELESYKAPAAHWNQVEGYLKDNAISPEQFRTGMTMLAALNSQDLGILRQTRDAMLQEVANLNSRLGESGVGYDPLKQPGNADLARAVEDQQITPEHAAELARARHEAQHYRGQQERQQQQTRQQQEQAQAVARAQAELDALGAEYAAIDPQFKAKADMLIPMLRPVFAKLSPAEWAPAFREAYRNLPATAIPQAKPAGAPALRNQPLRASALPPAGAAAVASTPDDIMQEALKAAAALDGIPYKAGA